MDRPATHSREGGGVATPMLNIGNVYGHGFSPPAVAELDAAGFAFRPTASRYEGAQLCHYLDFEEGPSLEVVEVEDPKAYLDFVPLGMKPYAPGISLVLPDWADRDFPFFEKRFADLRPYRLHVNYDGSKGRGRPGWNYLNFALPVIRDTFIWLTQLEEPRPRKSAIPVHPNGARGVRGLVFDIDAKSLTRLARLVETDLVDGAVDVDGVLVWSREALDGSLPTKPKVFPLAAVVVETADLGALPKGLAGRETTFGDRAAAHLRTNDLSWDLLLTGPWPLDLRRHA